MDASVKDSPGLCRCCFSEGCYKDLSTSYAWMGDTEIYADMLLECFDISITQHVDGPNGPNRLICEVCITRLRDASNFKKQVQDCEKKFIDMVAKGSFKPSTSKFNVEVVEEPKQPKLEPIHEEEVDAPQLDYLDDLDYDDDFDPKGEASTPHQSDDNEPLAKLTTRKRKLKPKKETVKSEKKAKTSKLIKKEDKPKTSKKGGPKNTTNNTDLSLLSSRKRNSLMKSNVVTILESTTALPFKWLRQEYLCYFCHAPFPNIHTVRLHTDDTHKESKIKNAVSYLKSDQRTKIEISDLKCRLCDAVLQSIEDTVRHLKDEHEKSFEDKSGYGVVPYIFSGDEYICGTCNESFKYFVSLNQHMNKHFSFYVCDTCGKSFVSQDRLRCHRLAHTQRPEKFLSCPHCEEMFKNCNSRKQHLAEAHKRDIPSFNCTLCPKKFYINSKLERHVKSVHNREKNFPCGLCEQKCFSKADVDKHRVKHTGDKLFQCEICSKAYPRRQTLKDHMKVHIDQRPYACGVCNERFVYKSRLLVHFRSKHSGS